MVRPALLAAIVLVAGLAGTASVSAASAGLQSDVRLAASAGGAWTTYHHDNAHTGNDPSAPAVSTVGPTSGWTESPLDGEVYAEPLIFGGRVYTATLNNTVYALNQTTGAIDWSLNLGAPQAGGWVCGNVSPMGILGTPVIDAAAGRIYVAAQFGSDHLYRVYGLNLSTGAVELITTIPAGIGTGFDWKIQQERGALALANGYVYVPFGGRAGDCFDGTMPYYGWVIGVPTDGISPIKVFETPSGAESVWASGGVVVDDTSHNVFFPTGNAIPCSGSTYSDAIVQTNPILGSPTFFEPKDWLTKWCGPDSDLGSSSPMLISPNLMFAAGKNGGGFLLDPTNLGGVNGQVFPSPTNYQQADVCAGNHSAATYGSFAYAAPFIYVECESRGIVALRVDTSTRTFIPCAASCPAPNWRAGSTLTFGPPIVAAGAVWAATNGGGLYAFNATTGAQIFHSAGFGVNRFVTPSEAGGQVFVPSQTVIKSFSFAGSVTVTPTRLEFGGQNPGTASSPMKVTLHNNQQVTLSVTATSLTGPNAGNYVKGSDTCTGMPVAAGGSCSVQVSFRPTGMGGVPAGLSFNDNGPSGSQSANLEGLGAIDNHGHLYTLDIYGGVHPDANSPALYSGTYFGIAAARSLALFPDGSGGYLLDSYGGLHPVGVATPPTSSVAYFGWDIARQVVLAPWSNQSNPAGWTLDGYGGVHSFGSAPSVGLTANFGSFDIARGLVVLPDSTPSAVAGYTLDGDGGLHPFGGAPAVSNFPYWVGWDIARGVILSPNASSNNPAGWILDGWGGVHPFGTAPAVYSPSYFGWDIARGLVAWTGAGIGGWMLDGDGGIHPFGTAPSAAPYPYWSGWDAAVSLAGPDSNSGSRGRP